MTNDLNAGRLSRRRLLVAASAAAGIGPVASAAAEEAAAAPATFGEGHHTYTLVPGWGKLPDGLHFKMGCAIVADRKDQVYVHSQADRMVVVFDRKGNLLRDFGTDFTGVGGKIERGACHGLYLHRVGNDEFLYFSVLNPYHQVIKTDLNGKELMRIGNVREENSTNIKAPLNNPTDVAVAPNGDIYVCDGYGDQIVRRFSPEGKFIQAIGKPGRGPGEFNTCHGIWVDTRGKKKHDPELYVADRANNRLQVFTLDGQIKRQVTESLRNPCCFYQHQDLMFVPDLAKVVTIFDPEDRPVASLGDGMKLQGDAAFVAPHALTLDSRGDLYVVEWVGDARLRKLQHTPRR